MKTEVKDLRAKLDRRLSLYNFADAVPVKAAVLRRLLDAMNEADVTEAAFDGFHAQMAVDHARAKAAEAILAAVRGLAEKWRYKGEFGWDDGSHDNGPDHEADVLDHAAHELLIVLGEAS